jgi:uncharacterized protein (DUF2141 family)
MNHSHLGCFMGILGASMAASFMLPQSLHAQPKPNRNLDVKFSGLRDSKGQVCLSLFAGPKGFPGDTSSTDFLMKRCAPVSNKIATITFDDLKPGNYAVSAFHDANEDSKMNKGGFGIPLEGFGFSNNPAIGFSAPSFTETQFKVSTTPTVIEIKLRYMN